MELALRSRTELVGNRHVRIHEMTESEIEALKMQRSAWGIAGFFVGVVGSTAISTYVLYANCFH